MQEGMQMICGVAFRPEEAWAVGFGYLAASYTQLYKISTYYFEVTDITLKRNGKEALGSTTAVS